MRLVRCKKKFSILQDLQARNGIGPKAHPERLTIRWHLLIFYAQDLIFTSARVNTHRKEA